MRRSGGVVIRRIVARGGRVAGLVLALGSSLFACTAVLGLDATHLRGTEHATDDAAAGGDGGTSSLVATPSAVVLRRGEAVDVRIAASAASGAAALRVQVSGLPPGVTADAFVLDAASHTGTLHLVATTEATLGPAAPVLTVDDGTTASPLALLVAGDPGSLDVTFDGDGRVELEGSGTVQALAVDPQGRVLVGGARSSGGWLLARLDASGAVDRAFAAALPDSGEVTALATTSDGHVLVVGWTAADAGPKAIAVARVLPAGGLDPTFGASGLARVAVAPGGARPRAVAVLEDETMVVAGERDLDGVLVRLARDGTVHPAFADGAPLVVPGIALVGVTGGSGTFVAGGTERAGPAPVLRLERRFLDGGLEPTFGTAGVLRFATTYEAEALARWGSDLALVGGAGPMDAGATYVLGVATSDGAERFARGTAAATGARFHGAAVSLGALVAAGNGTGAATDARVARVLPDAGLDPAYGTVGFARLDPADAGAARDVVLAAAAALPDGRVVVGGRRGDGRPLVLRLWP